MPSNNEQPRTFVPAAGRHSLLPMYDLFMRLFGIGALHTELIAQAAPANGVAVLDIGCGTGTLAVRLCSEYPGVAVTALDPDANALAIARRKAERAGVGVRFEQGYGDSLPFAEASFDRVLSSMMFHHLEHEVQQGMLREALRVLRPGGSLHMLDFGRDRHHHNDGLLARFVHRSDQLHGNADANVAALIAEAGFVEVVLSGARSTLLGRVAFHRASKPPAR